MAQTPSSEARTGLKLISPTAIDVLLLLAVPLATVLLYSVLTGGRGKAGGVKLVKNTDEAREAASKILGMDIKGYKVEKVLLAEGVKFHSEIYVGMTIDRNSKSVILMASLEGGVAQVSE